MLPRLTQALKTAGRRHAMCSFRASATRWRDPVCRPDWAFVVVALSVLLTATVAAQSTPPPWTFTPRPVTDGGGGSTVPEAGNATIALTLDDASAEGDFGINQASARQFMWFNQFTAAQPFLLSEIHVQFPAATTTFGVGSAIDLVVYQDTDANPANGAELVAVIDETVAVADGRTFSVYAVDLPQPIGANGDIYLGVVARSIVSGTTPPTSPAALDTTNSQGRSWIAVWQNDPPTRPELPADSFVRPVDDFVAGNWMIRGLGMEQSIRQIPTLSVYAATTITLAMMMAAFCALRRRS